MQCHRISPKTRLVWHVIMKIAFHSSRCSSTRSHSSWNSSEHHWSPESQPDGKHTIYCRSLTVVDDFKAGERRGERRGMGVASPAACSRPFSFLILTYVVQLSIIRGTASGSSPSYCTIGGIPEPYTYYATDRAAPGTSSAPASQQSCTRQSHQQSVSQF